jgi:glycosyltransferase involved in cell wall biosynthesis
LQASCAKKGLQQLLSAYAQIDEKRSPTWLIVGNLRAGTDRRIFEEFRQLHTRTRIIVTGYVSPRDLSIHYSLPDVVVQLWLRDCGGSEGM